MRIKTLRMTILFHVTSLHRIGATNNGQPCGQWIGARLRPNDFGFFGCHSGYFVIVVDHRSNNVINKNIFIQLNEKDDAGEEEE